MGTVGIELPLRGCGSLPFGARRHETLAGEFGGEFRGEGVRSRVYARVQGFFGGDRECGKGAGCAAEGGRERGGRSGREVGCLDSRERVTPIVAGLRMGRRSGRGSGRASRASTASSVLLYFILKSGVKTRRRRRCLAEVVC